ncbi:MAG: MFS transporter [Lachnospiraceae bacterium]|nr:MFS transporter [Lachnospiraceae bacterium]
MKKTKDNVSKISSRNLILIWVLGMAGQLCWNVENQWFNTFIYAKIGPYPWIISGMTACSAAATAFSTFLFGTASDRMGRRRPFIFWGYLLWGLFTVGFGASEFLPTNSIMAAAVAVIAMDAMMSFFGSMGNDAGFNSWTTDITNDRNRGQLGAITAAQPVLATIIGTVGSGLLIETFGYFTFFISMGIFVAIIGLIGVCFMKEGENLVPAKDEKGFWHQFLSVFNFKTFAENRELFWVFMIMTVYFICFNFYFAHIGNYFIYTLGYDEGMAGILQGVGLGLAVLSTIPAIKLINTGKHALAITIGTVSSIIGLLIVAVGGSNVILLIPGIILAGMGYVLILQTTTAWAKNLYPENNRGQFEGVRIVFFVLIPMVVGPSVATAVISRFGIPVVIDGEAGMAPSAILFVLAAVISVLTLIPTWMAVKAKKAKAAE